MNLAKLLMQLRADRDKYDATIETLERYAHASPRRRGSTLRNMVEAIDLVESANGTKATTYEPGPTRRGRKRRGGWRKPARSSYAFRSRTPSGVPRKIVEVPIPKGLELDGVEFPDAIARAVAAIKKPIPTPELMSVLQRAGARIPNVNQPPLRYLGMIAALLARDRRIKKTPRGWTRGSKG